MEEAVWVVGGGCRGWDFLVGQEEQEERHKYVECHFEFAGGAGGAGGGVECRGVLDDASGWFWHHHQEHLCVLIVSNARQGCYMLRIPNCPPSPPIAFWATPPKWN